MSNDHSPAPTVFSPSSAETIFTLTLDVRNNVRASNYAVTILEDTTADGRTPRSKVPTYRAGWF